MMKKANTETFDDLAKAIEPFLTYEAGTTTLKKTLTKLSAQAKILGKNLPEGYALTAVAAAKRRIKQDAFITKKEEARLYAEAKAIAAGMYRDQRFSTFPLMKKYPIISCLNYCCC